MNCKVCARIPTEFGDMFMYIYHSETDGKDHVAFVYDKRVVDSSHSRQLQDAINNSESSSISPPSFRKDSTFKEHTQPVLVRIHSQCVTSEIFKSHRCDCNLQWNSAMEKISQQDFGVLIYLQQEGRGIGLIEKLKYVLNSQIEF
jgi:3,4-dihydroxy 2-butanone 4-phosphate synthase/GTP cyclohydrolase II